MIFLLKIGPIHSIQILVNNAGISSHGETLDIPLVDAQRMVQVNTMAVMSLTHLFGRDMKERRRGRILLVSSVCGAVNGIATVAVYAATKAFENSLGAAIGKELEPYGVGLTCLMPGAVRGTEFRSRSNAQEALCWKLPFCTKTPPAVAESGVRALLRGDTEVTPGVLNRLFLKVFKPMLPQRMLNLLAEIMWNPLQLHLRRKNSGKQQSNTSIADSVEILKVESNSSAYNLSIVESSQRPMVVRPQHYHSSLPPPRILTWEEPSPEKENSSSTGAEIEVEESSTIASLRDPDSDVKRNNILNEDENVKPNVTPKTKYNEERNNYITESPGIDSTTIHQYGDDRMKGRKKTQILEQQSLPLSELDLLLDQYKRHRALSIDDPWSNGYNDRYIDSHMLPSKKGGDCFPKSQELSIPILY
jgi:short-subunit dehydrogenase